MADEARSPRSPALWPGALAFVVPLAAVTVGAILLWPETTRGFGPDARAMDCRFDSYCRGEDCSGPVPQAAQIVLNGYRGRSYMVWEAPLGQASVLPREAETVYAAPVSEDVFAVLTLYEDRRFDFRMTERRIDAPGFETGTGLCSAPAPLPQPA